MIREAIANELTRKGYKAAATIVTKNGIDLKGIRIMIDDAKGMVIYTDDIISQAMNTNKSVSEVAEQIIELYESNKARRFDVSNLMSREFILENVYVALQRKTTEELIKKSVKCMPEIEQYLLVRKDDYSFKLNKGIIENAKLKDAELWEKALENTCNETTIESLADYIASTMDLPEEDAEQLKKEMPVYIFTNTEKVKGASAILNKKALSHFASQHDCEEVIVLPSSIHECLVIPKTEDIDIDYLSQMVREVNTEHVLEIEQLSDKAYLLTI